MSALTRASYVRREITHAMSVAQFQEICAQCPAFRIGDADSGGQTVMHGAAMVGNIAVMRYIHRLDPSLVHRATNGSWTPLYFAVREIRYEAAKQLIEWGADVNAVRTTPLEIAIQREEELRQDAALEQEWINEKRLTRGRGNAARKMMRNAALVRLLLRRGAIQPTDGRGAELIGRAMAEEARATEALTAGLCEIPSLRPLPREVLAIAASFAPPDPGPPPPPALGVSLLPGRRSRGCFDTVKNLLLGYFS